MNWLVFAETSPDPTVALVVASLILVFAAAAGIYQRFDSINLKAENNRLDMALRAADVRFDERYRACEQRCDERCKGLEDRVRGLTDKLWVVEQQLREAQEKLRCQAMDSGSPSSKSSPTPTELT